MNKIDVKTVENKPETSDFPIKKQILLFGFGWLGFQLIASLIELFIMLGFLAFVDHDITAAEIFRRNDVSMAINSISYILLLGIMIFISFKDIKKLSVSFKKVEPYIAGFVCCAIILGFTIFYNVFLQICGIRISDNANETGITDISNSFPFLSVIIFGIVGPVCEELTYRVGLFGFLKKKISRVLAYLITIIIFSLIHFNLDFNNIINELLNIPFYAFAAFALTFTYEKFGLAGSLTAHLLNNILSLTLIRFIA